MSAECKTILMVGFSTEDLCHEERDQVPLVVDGKQAYMKNGKPMMQASDRYWRTKFPWLHEANNHFEDIDLVVKELNKKLKLEGDLEFSVIWICSYGEFMIGRVWHYLTPGDILLLDNGPLFECKELNKKMKAFGMDIVVRPFIINQIL